MSKIKDFISNFINGFCMALADSVPGVSGGTIAFLLGFYDNFINSLDDLFRGNLQAKKTSLIFLIKIGIGWVVGFLLSATILSNLFTTKIYSMSSLFIGFIIVAIPLVIKEEIKSIKGQYKNGLFSILGFILVLLVTLLSTNISPSSSVTKFNILTYIYTFFASSIAITAMVLPGISGSTLLLIFGLYLPVMNNIKALLTFDFSGLLMLIVFGFGVLFGIVFFVKLIRKCLSKYRSQVIFFIIGMMIASIYSIILGPTTIDKSYLALSFKTFDVLFFLLGIIIIVLLELLKGILNRK